MSHNRTIRVGDWVRFISAGELKIGAVEYVRTNNGYPHDLQFITDAGMCGEYQILEVRIA